MEQWKLIKSRKNKRYLPQNL